MQCVVTKGKDEIIVDSSKPADFDKSRKNKIGNLTHGNIGKLPDVAYFPSKKFQLEFWIKRFMK